MLKKDRIGEESEVNEIKLQDYFNLLRRNVWLILSVTLVVFGSTVFFVMQKPDIYRSYTTLLIEEPQQVYDIPNISTTKRPIGFYRGILSSRSYLMEVLDSIGGAPFLEVLPKKESDTVSVLTYIKDHIQLGASSFKSILQFTATCENADLSYQLAHMGTIVFRNKCTSVEAVQSKETIKQIEKHMNIIKNKLEDIEKKYQKAREATGSAGGGINSELKHLQDIYYKEKAQRFLNLAEIDASKKQLKLMEKKITPHSQKETKTVKKLRKKLGELEKEKRRLLSLNISISSASPLQKEINSIEEKLIKTKTKGSKTSFVNPKLISQWQALRNEVASKDLELELLGNRLVSYKNSIEKYKKNHPEILKQEFELLKLERAKNIFEKNYNMLLEKAEEAKIKSAAETGGIKIIDNAYKPNKPLPKNAGKFYFAGFLVGIILGVGLAFFLEIIDTSIKTSEDIEKYFDLPVLGTIPHIVIAKKDAIEIRRSAGDSKKRGTVLYHSRKLVDFKSDDSISSESYRSLRTNLLYASPDKPFKTMMISSSSPGEGKSLTVCNTAKAYAQTGSKVVIVDLDLRRPVLHHIFQTRREPGFCELFLPNPDWDDIVKPTKIENLFLITAGRYTPNPAELIGSKKMDSIIEELKNRFDIIFFDTPPVIAVTDATILAKKLDGVVLIARSGKTERDLFKRAENILENVGVKLAGVVINDIDLSNRYSSYGYYRYYYRYHRTKS